MAKRVANVRKESEERQAAVCLARMPVLSEVPVEPPGDAGVDPEDEIWEVADGPAEEYDENESETGNEVDTVAALLDLAQWVEVVDE